MEPWLDPLFDADGMRAVDRWAIEEQGAPSLELMEAAGRAVAEAVGELAPDRPVRVVCGKGNNAGDGLVAARYLAEAGFEVEALLLWPAEELSDDAAANFERCDAEYVSGDLGPRLAGSGAIVDAIFGTGFAGVPREPARAAIAAIDVCDAPVVACDIASGVDASNGEVAGAAVEADCTVSFHAAKLGHRVAPGKWHTGELRVAPIGIPAGAPASRSPARSARRCSDLAPPRGARSTKFSSGQVTIAGGSRGLTGAVQMSSLAAIRAGAGYATVAVPADLEPIFEAGRPEVMSVGCPGGDGCLAPASLKPLLRAFERAVAGVFGPGLGRDPGSVELAREVGLPDRGAAGARCRRPQRLRRRAGGDRGTRGADRVDPPCGRAGAAAPARLGRDRRAPARRGARGRRAAAPWSCSKGDDTIVTDGARVAVNALAAPALATAGTGDVLSGIAAAMLARGLEPFAAACAAVYAHARAGRDAAARIGAAESVIATDVIDSIAAGMRPDTRVE